jgi:hypothetical protein
MSYVSPNFYYVYNMYLYLYLNWSTVVNIRTYSCTGKKVTCMPPDNLSSGHLSLSATTCMLRAGSAYDEHTRTACMEGTLALFLFVSLTTSFACGREETGHPVTEPWWTHACNGEAPTNCKQGGPASMLLLRCWPGQPEITQATGGGNSVFRWPHPRLYLCMQAGRR